MIPGVWRSGRSAAGAAARRPRGPVSPGGDERGFALVAAVLVLMLTSMLVVTYYAVTTGERVQAANVEVARTAGLYLGRARRAIAAVKADVARELAAEDLKRTLQKQAESTGLHEIIEETREAATAAEDLFKPTPPPQPPAQKTEPPAVTASAPATPGTQHGD